MNPLISVSKTSIFHLPEPLFYQALSFLPLRDQERLALASHYTYSCHWNARILQHFPLVHSFYCRVMENASARPCCEHWQALHNNKEIVDKVFLVLKKKDKHFLIFTASSKGPSYLFRADKQESYAELFIRVALPYYPTYVLKPLNLVHILLGSEALAHKKQIIQLLTHKMDRGFCTCGWLGDRPFWVFGESHGAKKDEDFKLLAARASVDKIALFLEGVFAQDDWASEKISYELPPQALCKGLETIGGNERILNGVAVQWRIEMTTPGIPSPVYAALLQDLFILHTEVLRKAIDRNQQSFALESEVASLLDSLLNGMQNSPSLTQEHIDAIKEKIKKYPQSSRRFLHCLTEELLLQKERFTDLEHETLQAFIQNPSLLFAEKCEQLFLKKRDDSFAKNFLDALPSIPSKMPLVAILGSRHQRSFFSLVIEGFKLESLG